MGDCDEMTLIVRRSHVLQHVLPRMSRVSFEPAKQVVVGFSTVTYGNLLLNGGSFLGVL